MLIPLGMAEWCIPFWATFTLTLTSGLISSFFVYGAYLQYSVLHCADKLPSSGEKKYRYIQTPIRLLIFEVIGHVFAVQCEVLYYS